MRHPKSNKDRTIGFTPAVSKMLIRLFYACYRLGVSHAAEEQDEGLCRSHIEKTRHPGFFGTIMDEYGSNDLFWQLRLCELAADGGFTDPFDRFRRGAGRLYRNYYSVAYEVAQDFYNAGLKDFCETPVASNMPVFINAGSSHRVMWTRQGVKVRKLDKWVSEAQRFALERQYLTEQSDAKDKAKSGHYIAFVRGIKNACVVNYDAMT